MKHENFKKIVIVFFFIVPSIGFAKINVDKSSSIIHVENGATFVSESQITNYKGRLIRDAGATISGNAIGFVEGVFEDAGAEMKLTGDLNLGSGNKIELDGGKIFKGKRGESVQNLKISGLGNRIEGVVQFKENVVLQDSNSSFTCAIQGRFPVDIVLGGGTIYLEEDLHFLDDKFFIDSGTVKLNKRNLFLGSTEITVTVPIYFDQAQDIEMNANLHLAETWTFSGLSTIEGNGRILYLDDGGEIVIEQGSSLLFRDIAIRNISGNNIRCLDTNSTISFQNVHWFQDGDYSFTTGALEILENFCLGGCCDTFAYQSAQTSTIYGHSKLVVDRSMTFSFDPIWNSSVSNWDTARDFLIFADNTSILELKGATLHVTTTSLKLKKGTFRVKDHSYLVSELDGLFHMEEGLIIGNNLAADDMKFEIGVGSKFEISSGAFSYKNINSDSFDMVNNQSKVCVASDGKIKLHQDFGAGEGIVEFANNSKLSRVSGKSLNGAVHILGNITYEFCYN